MNDHEHRWMFLNSKGVYMPVSEDRHFYTFEEYAYLICNGCTTVIKQKIKTRAEVDQEDEH